MSKKVICFSLWGNNLTYTYGAIRNAEIALDIYPDWVCRYYVGESTDRSVIDALKYVGNTEIIEMREEGDWTGMFWRFYAASDVDVSVMLSRDCDSRLTHREKHAVNEWLSSDKAFHIMRDHPLHTTAILGGMWGVKNPKLLNMKTLIDNYVKGNFWQVDQNFLREVIYTLVVNDCFVHDEYSSISRNAKPFPKAKTDILSESWLEFDGGNDAKNPAYFVGKPYFYGDKAGPDDKENRYYYRGEA